MKLVLMTFFLEDHRDRCRRSLGWDRFCIRLGWLTLQRTEALSAVVWLCLILVGSSFAIEGVARVRVVDCNSCRLCCVGVLVDKSGVGVECGVIVASARASCCCCCCTRHRQSSLLQFSHHYRGFRFLLSGILSASDVVPGGRLVVAIETQARPG